MNRCLRILTALLALGVAGAAVDGLYEGWVVDVSGPAPVPYSTGTFDAADMADGDLAGCNGGVLMNQTDATFPQGVATLGTTVANEALGMGELKSLYR